MKTDIHTPLWMWPAGYTNIQLTRYPLSLLLGLSLFAHLLLLASWPSSEEKQVELALPVADFAVHLAQAKSSAKPAITNHPTTSYGGNVVGSPSGEQVRLKPHLQVIAASNGELKLKRLTPTTPTAFKPDPALKSVPTPASTRPVKTLAHKQMTPRQTSLTTSHPLTNEAVSESSHPQVISRLRDKLKQYFYYPRLAQRKNIQGTVVIGFAINLRGTLTNIRVVKSSGFAILDMAAEDALLKLHHLDGNQNWQADNRDLELPVIYKLTEG